MGFFSWITKDTNESIPNCYSPRDPITVYMHDNSGNVYEEDYYEGYGVFGEKDYYVLLAEMNNLKDKDMRSAGIYLAYDDKAKDVLYPQLTEDPKQPPPSEFLTECDLCDRQGFFY